MRLGFAATGNGRCAVIARVLTAPTPRFAVNDDWQDLGRNALLRAALRHFAAYGLEAAECARKNAEQAFFAGNRDGYRHWLAICRALDHRPAHTDRARRSPRAPW